MYVMLIMTSDASCVIADSFDDFATSFEFSYLWLYKA